MPIPFDIFSITSEDEFNEQALHIFRRQCADTITYKKYIEAIHVVASTINHYTQIPFLPIRFFKTHEIKTGEFREELTFTSSSTTGSKPSRHFIRDVKLYEKSFSLGFSHFYGSPGDYCILALLPSYLEREGSSLVFMAQHLIRETGDPRSGFFLDQFESLYSKLQELKRENKKTILLGVTFALLDFARHYPGNFENLIVMETGGMKGRGEELTRAEVHALLKQALAPAAIHSEYGMTELMSQAYSERDGVFRCPPWMKVLLRDVTDPLSLSRTGGTGGINIIDLANKDSCSFIATDDLGRISENSGFEVVGRYDQSEIRGCNLMFA